MIEIPTAANGGVGKNRSDAIAEGFFASLLTAFQLHLNGMAPCVPAETPDSFIPAHNRVDSVSEGPARESLGFPEGQLDGAALQSALSAALPPMTGETEVKSLWDELGVQAFGLDSAVVSLAHDGTYEAGSAALEVFRALEADGVSRSPAVSDPEALGPEGAIAEDKAAPQLAPKAGVALDASPTAVLETEEKREAISVAEASEAANEGELDQEDGAVPRASELSRRPASHGPKSEDSGLEPEQVSEPVQHRVLPVLDREDAGELQTEEPRLDLTKGREVAESLYRESLKNLPRSIELRLDPPELGKVSVLLVTRGEEVAVKFIAESHEALRAIEQAAPELEQALQEQGLVLTGALVQQGSRDGRPHAEERRFVRNSGGRLGGIKSVSDVQETVGFFRPRESALDYLA